MRTESKSLRKKKLISAGSLMLDRLTEGIAGTDAQDFAAMKNAAACLKELKELLFICPDLDEREQDAKIRSLLRRAGDGPAENVLRLEMAEELEQFTS